MPFDFNDFRAQEQRRQRDRENAFSVAPKPYRLSGEVLVRTGDVPHFVNFPFKYIQKPLFSFGAEVDGQEAEAGEFPTVSVVVLKWVVEERPPATRYYMGATLGISTTGPPTQTFSIHYHFDGVAIVNPSSSSTSLEVPI